MLSCLTNLFVSDKETNMFLKLGQKQTLSAL